MTAHEINNSTAYGHSIYKHDPKCKVAKAFEELTKEVLKYGC